jgi:membrane-associated protein
MFPDLNEWIPLLGYPGIFAIIFAESGLPIGFFLPGSSLLFTSGFLASQGFFEIGTLIALLTFAAVLGDNVGYWLGARVGIKFFSKPNSRFFKREYLDKTRNFYARYGALTIFLARMVPMVRTFAPIFAGIAGMNYFVFMFYNVLGAILWGGGIVYAGYILGALFPQSSEYVEMIIIGIVVVSCIPLVIEYFRHKKKHAVPSAVIFDLDDTLTEAFKAPSPEITSRLHRLMKHVPVAIMSGASHKRLKEHIIETLPHDIDKSRLYIFPDTAAQCFSFKNGDWKQEYSYMIDAEDREMIVSTIESVVTKLKHFKHIANVREHVIVRDAQITFTALPNADDREKMVWDPRGKKRVKLSKILQKKLPQFEVLSVARTSIDITKKGIDKAFGVRWFASELNVKPEDMLFVGDALFPGGNDFVVMKTKIETKQVVNPSETAVIIDKLLSHLE